MLYRELFKEAQKLVDFEQRSYAIEKLANLMRTEKEILSHIERQQKKLEKIREDIDDLGTQKIGYLPSFWGKGVLSPPTGMLTNIS